MLRSFILTLAAAGWTAAAPYSSLTSRSLDCNNPVKGLSREDCQYMSNLGITRQGENAHTPNNFIWIGDEGPFKFHFKNDAPVPQTLILWHVPTDNEYLKGKASFIKTEGMQISYSLAPAGQPGASVTVSMGHDISGAYSWLSNRQTALDWGQVDNTWGEFHTGNGGDGTGCTNVSKLAKMNGRHLTITTPTCVADSTRCSFVCNNGAEKCGEYGEVQLLNCTEDTNPGSGSGIVYGKPKAPEGGCYGFDNSGDIRVSLG